jgi:hypothetical protein
MSETDLTALSEAMARAQANYQTAKVIGDPVAIEIARADLKEAMHAVDVALDSFENTVLGGRFQRKRDLPARVIRFRGR